MISMISIIAVIAIIAIVVVSATKRENHHWFISEWYLRLVHWMFMGLNHSGFVNPILKLVLEELEC